MFDRTKLSEAPIGLSTAVGILTPTPDVLGSATQWAIATVRDFAAAVIPDEKENRRMSELSEALKQFETVGGPVASFAAELAVGTYLSQILDAARKWDNLTSDENVETVAGVLGGKSARVIGAGDGAKRAARVVLDAVKEGNE